MGVKKLRECDLSVSSCQCGAVELFTFFVFFFSTIFVMVASQIWV